MVIYILVCVCVCGFNRVLAMAVGEGSPTVRPAKRMHTKQEIKGGKYSYRA